MKKYEIEPNNDEKSRYEFEKEEVNLRTTKKLKKLLGFD